MRKLTILFLTLGTWIYCNGQTQSVQRNAVQIISPQTFYLNGRMRATFGGKSRTYFYLEIPPNTVEWYYSFTTTRNEQQNNSIDLISQLTNLIDPSYGASLLAKIARRRDLCLTTSKSCVPTTLALKT